MTKSNSAKRRGNGEGSIHYNDSRKSWVVQYYVSGKRKTKYARTKGEAHKLLVKAQSMVLEGTYFDPSTMNVEDWLKIWFDEYMVDKRAPKTVEGHLNSINKYIVPMIGKMRLMDLKGYHVQQMYNAIGKTRSARTIKLVHITLSVALNQAVMNDMIQQNVTKKCIIPKHYPKKSRALTIDEQERFVHLIKGHRFELIYLICLYSGLRRGEAIALQWTDIDFDRLSINVNKTASRVKIVNPQLNESSTTITVKHPKSKSSLRVVPLAKQLVPLLKAHRKEESKTKLSLGPSFNPDNYVFTNDSGGVLDGGYVSRVFHKLTKDFFERPATVHTLRHTFATRGAESGVSMKVMQELCGHSTIDITADIYTHISDDFKAKEFSKINVIL